MNVEEIAHDFIDWRRRQAPTVDPETGRMRREAYSEPEPVEAVLEPLEGVLIDSEEIDTGDYWRGPLTFQP